jgi:ketosteroid isomerase-like protein
MSQENVEGVPQPIAVRAYSRRRLAERLGLRFPGVVALVSRAVYRLRPQSRLRQAVVHRVAVGATEAVNRGDHEAAFVFHHPDVELHSPPEMVGLGEDSVTRGREERVRFQRTWTAQWGEVRFEPEEVTDLGDRMLMIGRMKGSGLSSGAAFDSEWANLTTISAGRVIREQVFRDHREALKAAGLRE